jgi:hypothetical protein
VIPALVVVVPLEGPAWVGSRLGSASEIRRLVDWVGRGGDARAELVLDFLVAIRELDRDDLRRDE